MSFYVIALTFINTHVRRNLAIKNPIDHLKLFCLGLLQLIFFLTEATGQALTP